MKTLILVVTILVSNVCMADLASQLASAIDESSQAKTASEANLKVDLNSVKAAFVKSGAVTTIKHEALVEDVSTNLVKDQDEEVIDARSPEASIAAEVKESRLVAQKNK